MQPVCSRSDSLQGVSHRKLCFLCAHASLSTSPLAYVIHPYFSSNISSKLPSSRPIKKMIVFRSTITSLPRGRTSKVLKCLEPRSTDHAPPPKGGPVRSRGGIERYIPIKPTKQQGTLLLSWLLMRFGGQEVIPVFFYVN